MAAGPADGERIETADAGLQRDGDWRRDGPARVAWHRVCVGEETSPAQRGARAAVPAFARAVGAVYIMR